MSYVDGFVLVVPKRKIAIYKKMATRAAKVWRDHGALDYKECAADDLSTTCGTSFSRVLKLKPSETVVFAYVVFKSRAHRDRVNANVMKDPRITAMCDLKNMPFDPKRMTYGGFKTIVE